MIYYCLLYFFRKLDHETADTSLPAVTASLEMLTVNANLTPPKKRAILRRLSRVDPNESLNRRYKNV